MSKKTWKTLYFTLSFLSLILALVVIFRLAAGAGAGQERLASGKDYRGDQVTMAPPDIAGKATGTFGDWKPAVVVVTKKQPGPAGR
jgi:hypothetical protein